MIRYPEIDKVAIHIGDRGIHWYGIMYVIGIVIAYILLRARAKKPGSSWEPRQAEDIVFWSMVGLLVGARIFYMVIYGFDQLVANPLSLLKIWQGGMSFHGGLIGVMVAMWWYARRQGRSFWEVTDFLAPAAPPGLFFGRMGNFINGELWGKPTDLPWGFFYDGTARPEVAAVFADGQARHPSQLYEAGLEGIVLFIVLWLYSSRPRPTMAVSGLFLTLYGVFRFAVEFVRLPDTHMGEGGYLAFGWFTTGQALSAPMILFGIMLMLLAYARASAADEEEGEATT